jgi:hypothetical protein
MTRTKFGFEDIEKKIRFNSSADKLHPDSKLRARRKSEIKFLEVVPKKQYGRKRSSSYQKVTHKNTEDTDSIYSVNSMTLEEGTEV